MNDSFLALILLTFNQFNLFDSISRRMESAFILHQFKQAAISVLLLVRIVILEKEKNALLILHRFGDRNYLKFKVKTGWKARFEASFIFWNFHKGHGF